jgi:heme-degrading monooxygenase HmoA
MISIIWSFRVRTEREQEFVAAYGPNGDWVQLFGKSEGYRGTQLLKDSPGSQRYVTIDSWDSSEDFDRFKRDFHREYIELDGQFEPLTELEEPIGVFEVVATK